MKDQSEQKEQNATVWPPPIQHDTLPTKPLSKHEIFLARWRWFNTVFAPFWLLLGILDYSEHKLYRDIEIAFIVLVLSVQAIRGWMFYARLRRDGIEGY